MREEADSRRAACPIWGLDDWVLEHHDVVTLCRGFDCPECVADPEDLGPTEPRRRWTSAAVRSRSRRLLSGSAGPCANPQKFRARTRKKCVHIPKLGLD